MATLELQFDTSELERIKGLVSSREYAKIQQRALAYAARSVKPAVGKSISSRYGITSTRVKADVRGPFLRANGLDYEADLFFARKPPTGMQYSPRQAAGGLSLGIFRGSRTQIRDGFIQTTRRGQQLTFKPSTRTYGGDRGRKKPRRALEVVYGPSTGAIFAGRSRFGNDIQNEVRARAGEQFDKGVARAYQAMVRGFAK